LLFVLRQLIFTYYSVLAGLEMLGLDRAYAATDPKIPY
jgi:hypothetical protein